MKNIATKMAQAMKAIDAVTKDGRNDKHGYKYVRATDVANEVRKALADAGIAFQYAVTDERFWDAETKSGGMQFYCSLTIDGTFIDSETGEAITSTAIGWGADTQDKAPYKAMTGALKYLMRMTFIIPDEMDPENDKEEPQELAPRPKLISKLQRDLFVSAVKEKGISTDEIKAELLSFGFSSSGEITQEKLSELTKWVEEYAPH